MNRLGWDRLCTTGTVLLQASLRLLSPEAFCFIFGQLIQACEQPFRQGRAIANVETHGILQNLR
jgi:hypothetical protein